MTTLILNTKFIWRNYESVYLTSKFICWDVYAMHIPLSSRRLPPTTLFVIDLINIPQWQWYMMYIPTNGISSSGYCTSGGWVGGTGRSLHCQVENHVRTKFATPILYAMDIFKNYDIFSTYTYILIISIGFKKN